MKKQIYFASPLFSSMEYLYNEHLVKQIRKLYPNELIYLPQEQGDINDKSQYADSKKIAKYDTDQLLNSKLVIAVIDGNSIDPGVSAEIGIAYQSGIPIIGLFTDSRQLGAEHPDKLNALKKIGESQFPYVNLYVVGLIKLNGELVNSETDLIKKMKKYL